MTLQKGVRVVGLKPETLLAMIIVSDVYAERALQAQIMSIVDGNHDGGPYMTSSHYAGNAFDVAIPSSMDLKTLLNELNDALGDQYFMDVNAEQSHIHISYMPTRP